MSFSIVFYKEAANYLENLPTNISERIINKFEDVKQNPFRYLEHYEEEFTKDKIEFIGIISIQIFKLSIFEIPSCMLTP